MERVNVGDPVTIATLLGSTIKTIVLDRTDAVIRTKVFTGSFSVTDSDEGITWIRGHHDPDSDAVKALLATYALYLC